MNALSLDTVRLSEDGASLIILDQTLLPGEIRYLELSRAEDIWEAIYTLRVRGAPAIGVAAAYGVWLLADQEDTGDMALFCQRFQAHKDYLNSARPTAVNLSWALNRMEKVLEAERDGHTVPELKKRLLAEAHAIREEDIAISRAIGSLGFDLLHPGDGILTHCNAGTLATAKYGTATAPMYVAQEHGWTDFRVYCDETRPLLQGARLTAYELVRDDIPVTLICDDMAGYLMAQGQVDLVIAGCDRMAANGDFANKIGTYSLAVLAKHHGIPFYTALPSSTIDLSIPDGSHIPVEQRDGQEVACFAGLQTGPLGVQTWNPAFDVTPHDLLTAIITERGVLRPPFDRKLSGLVHN